MQNTAATTFPPPSDTWRSASLLVVLRFREKKLKDHLVALSCSDTDHHHHHDDDDDGGPGATLPVVSDPLEKNVVVALEHAVASFFFLLEVYTWFAEVKWNH